MKVRKLPHVAVALFLWPSGKVAVPRFDSMPSRAALTVQRQIQPQHIDTWIAEQPQYAALGMCSDQATNFLRDDAARRRHSLYLVLGRCRADMRIEAAG